MKHTWALWVLLALAVVRLWLMPMRSSLWTDETGTVFAVHYGVARAWTAVAPELPVSLYYPLPELGEAVGGYSEVAFRLPSAIALGIALLLIARLAARLIHPQAAWFAVFACLSMHGFNFQAADARPYALGTALAVAAVWFLVRWFDTARWRYAALFVLCAALLWPVHPLYWPFYAVFAAYALARIIARDTAVKAFRAAALFGVLLIALTPMAVAVLAMAHGARSHVISELPEPKALWTALEPALILASWLGALLLSKIFRWKRDTPRPAGPSLALILPWWLAPPLCLYAFSQLTGIGVFVPRYFSLALPGAALGATLLAALYVPKRMWTPLSLLLAAGIVLVRGDWRELWPPHTGMDWRDAAQAINRASSGADIPVIFPSPFVEAQPPKWTPDLALPSALYSPLAAYPLTGRVFPFPYTRGAALPFADELTKAALRSSPGFFVYGHRENALFWENWFERRPELSGWTHRSLGSFGDIVAVEFKRPPTT